MKKSSQPALSTNIAIRVQQLKNKYAEDISTSYKHSISNFARDLFGITLWDSEIADSQKQIADAVMLSLLKQEERQEVELGKKLLDDCLYYEDGEVIQTIIDVQSGHGTGKSYLSAIVALWVYTVFDDSVTYTISPTKNQATSILWRDIRTLHSSGGIKGKALELSVKDPNNPNNFIAGRVAPTGKAQDTTSIHGLHSRVFCAIVDESQHYGVGLFDGLDSVMSGGIAVMLMSSNPKSETVPARRYRVFNYCKNFTLNALYHPNVYFGKSIIPGGVTRDYVSKLLSTCEPVDEHKSELNTFTIDWLDDPNQIYVPSAQFSWRVLGVPSANSTGNVFFSSKMFENALNLPVKLADSYTIARIGVDVARFGSDDGVIYYRHKGVIRLYSTISRHDGNEYVRQISKLLNYLAKSGVTDVQIRLDSTGGYASTIEDTLDKNQRWSRKFLYFEIVPVNFRSYAQSVLDYDSIITEMYAETAKAFNKGLRYRGFVPETLITELTQRTYDYVPITAAAIKRLKHNKPESLHRIEVKRISKKIAFRNEYGYSPDYGDAICLCGSPDWVFVPRKRTVKRNAYADMQKKARFNRIRRQIGW